MTSVESPADAPEPTAEWPFPTAAALGSSVRTQGIERELRARLPFPDRKRLTVENGRIQLRMPAGQEERLAHASRIVADVLGGINTLPVLPSEAEDILAITPRERLKWTKDGRLRSAGTRTVKLRGRAKTVTFHVFDPRQVEDILDAGLPDVWRKEDAQASAEARRRAAGKAALTRAGKTAGESGPDTGQTPADDEADPELQGWKAFSSEGLLR